MNYLKLLRLILWLALSKANDGESDITPSALIENTGISGPPASTTEDTTNVSNPVGSQENLKSTKRSLLHNVLNWLRGHKKQEEISDCECECGNFKRIISQFQKNSLNFEVQPNMLKTVPCNAPIEFVCIPHTDEESKYCKDRLCLDCVYLLACNYSEYGTLLKKSHHGNYQVFILEEKDESKESENGGNAEVSDTEAFIVAYNLEFNWNDDIVDLDKNFKICEIEDDNALTDGFDKYKRRETAKIDRLLKQKGENPYFEMSIDLEKFFSENKPINIGNEDDSLTLNSIVSVGSNNGNGNLIDSNDSASKDPIDPNLPSDLTKDTEKRTNEDISESTEPKHSEAKDETVNPVVATDKPAVVTPPRSIEEHGATSSTPIVEKITADQEITSEDKDEGSQQIVAKDKDEDSQQIVAKDKDEGRQQIVAKDKDEGNQQVVAKDKDEGNQQVVAKDKNEGNKDITNGDKEVKENINGSGPEFEKYEGENENGESTDDSETDILNEAFLKGEDDTEGHIQQKNDEGADRVITSDDETDNSSFSKNSEPLAKEKEKESKVETYQSLSDGKNDVSNRTETSALNKETNIDYTNGNMEGEPVGVGGKDFAAKQDKEAVVQEKVVAEEEKTSDTNESNVTPANDDMVVPQEPNSEDGDKTSLVSSIPEDESALPQGEEQSRPVITNETDPLNESEKSDAVETKKRSESSHENEEESAEKDLQAGPEAEHPRDSSSQEEVQTLSETMVIPSASSDLADNEDSPTELTVNEVEVQQENLVASDKSKGPGEPAELKDPAKNPEDSDKAKDSVEKSENPPAESIIKQSDDSDEVKESVGNPEDSDEVKDSEEKLEALNEAKEPVEKPEDPPTEPIIKQSEDSDEAKKPVEKPEDPPTEPIIKQSDDSDEALRRQDFSKTPSQTVVTGEKEDPLLQSSGGNVERSFEDKGIASTSIDSAAPSEPSNVEHGNPTDSGYGDNFGNNEEKEPFSFESEYFDEINKDIEKPKKKRKVENKKIRKSTNESADKVSNGAVKETEEVVKDKEQDESNMASILKSNGNQEPQVKTLTSLDNGGNGPEAQRAGQNITEGLEDTTENKNEEQKVNGSGSLPENKPGNPLPENASDEEPKVQPNLDDNNEKNDEGVFDEKYSHQGTANPSLTDVSEAGQENVLEVKQELRPQEVLQSEDSSASQVNDEVIKHGDDSDSNKSIPRFILSNHPQKDDSKDDQTEAHKNSDQIDKLSPKENYSYLKATGIIAGVSILVSSLGYIAFIVIKTRNSQV